MSERVVFTERMPVLAVGTLSQRCATSLSGIPATDVLLLRHRFHVSRIAATANATQMVELQTMRNGADERLVR
jgi:hypothetical protein